MSESEEQSKTKKKKTKFKFKCTRCDACCRARGPIPVTMWDLEMWARNQVISNFLPYLEVYEKPDGGVDLLLKPSIGQDKTPEQLQQNPEEALKETPIEELLDRKCPLYNEDKEKCLVYENRPLSCRTYPLEYDGKNYRIADLDCPGIGEAEMTKEDLKQMRENAKRMNSELTRIRIALPVLNQIISRKVMTDLMRQNMQAMNQMSDEDRAKLEEIFGKAQQRPPG